MIEFSVGHVIFEPPAEATTTTTATTKTTTTKRKLNNNNKLAVTSHCHYQQLHHLKKKKIYLSRRPLAIAPCSPHFIPAFPPGRVLCMQTRRWWVLTTDKKHQPTQGSACETQSGGEAEFLLLLPAIIIHCLILTQFALPAQGKRWRRSRHVSDIETANRQTSGAPSCQCESSQCQY